jgi:hypothetical protein
MPTIPLHRRAGRGVLLAALAPALSFACVQAWDQYDSRLPCADPANCGAPNCDGTPKLHCAAWSDRWGDTMHSLDPSYALDVAVGDGGVAFVGYGQGTFDLGLSAAVTLDDPSLVLAWVHADTGKVVWAVTGQGDDGGAVYGSNVAVDPRGKVYVLGRATDGFTLAPWAGDGDAGLPEGGAFVARIGADGVPERVVRLGPTTSAKEAQDPASGIVATDTHLYAVTGSEVWSMGDTLVPFKLGYYVRASFHAVVPAVGGVFVGGIEHPDGGPEAGVGSVRFASDVDAGPAGVALVTTEASSAQSFSKVQALALASCQGQRFLYAAGQFNDDVTFPGQPPIAPPVPGVAEVFLARFTLDLSQCDWVRHAAAAVADGGQSYQSLYGPTALAADGKGGLLLGFSFRGRMDFDQGGSVAVLGSTADLDMAVVDFSCDGQFQWARRFGQDSACLSCMSPNAVPNLLASLAVGPNGTYLAGTANTSIDFGSGVLAPVGLTDLVLVDLVP